MEHLDDTVDPEKKTGTDQDPTFIIWHVSKISVTYFRPAMNKEMLNKLLRCHAAWLHFSLRVCPPLKEKCHLVL